MVSRKEHTQSLSLQGMGGRWVTHRQSAKGEIKEDICYISSDRRRAKKVHFRRGSSRGVKQFTVEETETTQCNHKGQGPAQRAARTVMKPSELDKTLYTRIESSIVLDQKARFCALGLGG